jgi:hypothetical protein
MLADDMSARTKPVFASSLRSAAVSQASSVLGPVALQGVNRTLGRQVRDQ